MEYSSRPDYYYLLLAHAVLDPVFCAQTAEIIEPEWFCDPAAGGNHWQTLAFNAIKEFWLGYRSVIDASTFRMAIQRSAANWYPQGSPAFVEFQERTAWFVNEFVPGVTASSTEVAKDVRAYLIKRCKFDVEVQSLASQIQYESDGDIQSHLINRLAELRSKQRMSADGFSESGFLEFEDTSGRVLTGVDFIDSRLGVGKGPVKSAVFGIIIPQGGGKTTLGNQISVSQALMGKPGMLVIGEQGMDPDYKRRLISVSTGIPTPVLEAHRNDIKSAAAATGVDYDAAMTRALMVEKNLSWVDLIMNPITWEEAEIEIERRCEASAEERLEVIYVDWGSAIARMMKAQSYRGLRIKDEYDALSILGESLSGLAARNNVLIVISQQMAAEYASKPYMEVDHYSCLTNRMFMAQFKYVMTVQCRCPRTQLQVAGIPKARGDPFYVGADRFIVSLDGERGIFNERSDYIIKGRIKPSTSSSNPNAMPKE